MFGHKTGAASRPGGRCRGRRPRLSGAILDNRSNVEGRTMAALDTFRLDGKVALIAGGGGAIGSALAEGLASAGARVAVTGRTADTLEETVARVAAAGSEGLAVAGDATSEAEA